MKKIFIFTILILAAFNYTYSQQVSFGWEVGANARGACANNVKFTITSYDTTVLTISEDEIELVMPIIDDIRLPNGVEVIDSTILEFKATTTSRYPDTLVGGYYYIPGTFYWTTYTPDEIKNGDCNHVADYFKYTGFGAIKLTVDSLFVGGTVKGDMDYYCGNTLFETTKFYFLIRGVRIFEPNGDINYGGTAKTKPFTLTISPNPVYNNATIKYNLASASNVNISIYDMMNNPVKMLINTKQQAGNYSLQWDGRYSNGNTAATGIYTALAIIDGKKYIYKIQVLK